MWVVAELVNRHHGAVRVWSTQREGRSGTAFSVFLPFGEGPAAEELMDEAVPAES
jgi:nitrogen-specific signal transduction histidine kinase